ncbi:thioredoxin-related protein [Thiogranum longum]|uniref:Thioredoxin-related protein n=1 Tax=Thiogranum longum TaxID=1537524 RepID=A0A4V2PGT4_9GAMM|nr:thioredoxin fold domain-containing protein [Thiogranum longum]TCK18056.1 thioredoxin-related protein [Thiogranum longum]
MKHGLLALLFFMLAQSVGFAEQASDYENPGYHEKPAWFKNSFLDLREDVADAARAGKRVMLYFYQDGCPYCAKLLDTNFAQREIAENTQKYFDVIAINMWGALEVTDLNGKPTTEKDFATELKVMYTPTLLFLDEQGKVILRLNGYYPPHKFSAVIDYVGQHMEKETSFPDFWKARSPSVSSGKLHRSPDELQPPYRLDKRASGKPLLVLFEQKDCAACDELHQDILARDESRKLLSKFDVVLLDMWSKTPLTTPDGKRTTAAKWARTLNVQYVPTLVMFDSEGREVFRSEAYLRTFHIQSVLDYVASGAYREQPNFQRYIQKRAEALEAQGVHINLMD